MLSSLIVKLIQIPKRLSRKHNRSHTRQGTQLTRIMKPRGPTSVVQGNLSDFLESGFLWKHGESQGSRSSKISQKFSVQTLSSWWIFLHSTFMSESSRELKKVVYTWTPSKPINSESQGGAWYPKVDGSASSLTITEKTRESLF